MSALIFGATGLCGNEILKAAVASSQFTQLTTVTRRDFDFTSEKLKKIVEADSSKYSEITKTAGASVLFSALATTMAAAGTAKRFVEIDYDLNYEIAKAAKEAGVKTFVLVTCVGANASSPFLYLKTKGRIERDVIALKFPNTIILRPGQLLGPRDKAMGLLHDISAGFHRSIHNTFLGNNVFFPVYGHEVGKVAVHLAQKTINEGEAEPKVHIVGGKELLAIARSLE